MRGTRAKQLRRMVYKDFSLRMKRKYVYARNGGIANHPTSLRSLYLRAKALFRKGVPIEAN